MSSRGLFKGEDDADEAFEEESPDDNQLVFLSHHEDYYTHWAEEFFNDFRSADRLVIDEVLFHASVTNNYAKVSPTFSYTTNDWLSDYQAVSSDLRGLFFLCDGLWNKSVCLSNQ